MKENTLLNRIFGTFLIIALLEASGIPLASTVVSTMITPPKSDFYTIPATEAEIKSKNPDLVWVSLGGRGPFRWEKRVYYSK